MALEIAGKFCITNITILLFFLVLVQEGWVINFVNLLWSCGYSVRVF